MAVAKVKYDALISTDEVNSAFVTAQSAVDTAIDQFKTIQTLAGHFTRHSEKAAVENTESQQAVAQAFSTLDGMKSKTDIDQQLLDLTTHKNTADIKTKNVTENFKNAASALELARTRFGETTSLIADVENKFKIFEEKYNNAVRPEADAAAPGAAAAADTAADAPTLAQLKKSFAAIEEDERFKKKDEYVVESRQIVDKYDQMLSTFKLSSSLLLHLRKRPREEQVRGVPGRLHLRARRKEKQVRGLQATPGI
jgi:hypothetical protein